MLGCYAFLHCTEDMELKAPLKQPRVSCTLSPAEAPRAGRMASDVLIALDTG